MKIEDFISIVKPFSMTSIERITCLFDSLEYIRTNSIDGDIVECGVWKGGNILGIIEYLNYYNIQDKNVWLYDTFSGMTEAGEFDFDHNNTHANQNLHYELVRALSPIEEVKSNLSSSNFNKEKLKFIVGDVSETLIINENLPKQISILRLDTDWYKSTKDELNILYPLLVTDGVLIIDDYGHWKGAKKATDEYFKTSDIKFEEIDYTGIKIIKK